MGLFNKFFKQNPEKKYNEALEHLRLNRPSAAANAAGIAANAGWAQAQTLYSHLLRDGVGVAKNAAEAARWLKAAAENGDPQAIYEYAMTALNADEQRAEQLSCIRSAAEGGCGAAMAVLGQKLLRGDGVEQDYTSAFSWLTKSAEKGSRLGMAALAEMYRDGLATVPDGEIALKYFELFIEKYPNDSAAVLAARRLRIDLGLMSAEEYARLAAKLVNRGGAVRRSPRSIDFKSAAEYARRAAEGGNADGQLLYSEFLHDGTGVEKDIPLSLEYLSKAAENGSITAMERLGKICYEGALVERDIERAVKWLSRAAEENSAASQAILGKMYLEGDGIAPDADKAFELFFAASEHDEPLSQYYIGYMFYKGIGRKQNFSAAEKWFLKAAKHRKSEKYPEVMELLRDIRGRKNEQNKTPEG